MKAPKCLTILFSVAVSVALSAQSPPRDSFAGLTVSAALHQLQLRGLTIVYSSSLVRPEMRVEGAPSSTDPRRILDEILAPHALRVREGPQGQLIVVPSPRRAMTPASEAATPTSIPVFLDQVVVTPSFVELLDESIESSHFLSREEVDQIPHLANDVFWAVKRLPGTASDDLSAEFNVRGGDADELLVTIDGVELYEPFHLKDFLKIFSIVDSSAIGELDLHTGGFPVEYGGRLSGVMDISTRIPSDPGTTVDVGLIESGILTSGRSDDGRSEWLLTARGWYPDVIHEALPSDSPTVVTKLGTDYYDLFGKFTRPLGGRSGLTASLLIAWDDLGFRDQDPESIEQVAAKYGTAHAWTRIDTAWTSRTAASTVLAIGNLTRERRGGVSDIEDGELRVDDDRNFRFVSIKQDWARDFSDRHLLKWGAELKAEDASYDYGRTQPEGEVHVDLEQSGESYAAYVADRFRIGNSVVAELGLRWDKQFWTEDQQLAPRLNVRYAHRSGTLLRAAWGRYHQWEQLNELPVEDGVSDFRTAQRADHILLSVERAFGNGLAVRVDAYEKQLRNSRPRFENLWSSLELFPEAERDRVLVAPDEGRSRGIELLVKGDPARPLSWWGGYTLSKAVDVIDGRDVPRSWDQRHAVTFGVNRRLPRGWNVNLAGTYHSGRPTTPAALDDEGEPVPLERNSARLPDYHRFDARVTRAIVSRFGEITFTAEVLNLTGRANVCCVNEFSQEEGRVVPEYRYWPRVIPSFSIRWRR